MAFGTGLSRSRFSHFYPPDKYMVVVFMIPFTVGKKESLIQFLKNIRHIFSSVGIVGVFIFIQMLFWNCNQEAG